MIIIIIIMMIIIIIIISVPCIYTHAGESYRRRLRIDLRSEVFYEVLLRCTPFYLHTLTFVVLNSLLVHPPPPPFFVFVLYSGIRMTQKTDFHLMNLS